MKNTIPASPALRQPRGLVKINGEVVTGWERFETEATEFYSPDTFSICFAMSKLPAGKGVDWFASQTSAEVELFAGFPPDPANFSAADLDSIFFGRVDEVDFDWVAMTIDLTGRDLTAPLIDHKTSEKYVNQTASQVAAKLAKTYGLATKITATKTKVGRYYEIDHVDLKSDRTEWDLLTYLARQEGFVVFVQGKTLHFQPRPNESQDPWVIDYTPVANGSPPVSNVEALNTQRSLTVAKGIEVTVTSWNSKSKRAFKRKSVRRGGGDLQKYAYTIAGLTPDEAQKRADKIRDEISRHERRLSFSGPADNVLTIADVIKLQGTGTAFDQVYYPESIQRSVAASGGYGWSVSAKNHSPESEPTL